MEINQDKKIPVAVLGATGAVGQRFVQLLANHPWFTLKALLGSERSIGKPYGECCRWLLNSPVPPEAVRMVVQPVEPGIEAVIVFSALPADLALEVEPAFARAGYAVCSNSSAFRLEADVPLVIPEVNADHLEMVSMQKKQRGWKGLLVASPNCTTTAMAIPLKAINQAFGVRKVLAVSLQAVSGAGYPGLAFLDIHDNVIPYITGEEEKMERETRLLLGSMRNGHRVEAPIQVSAQANRVPVTDGHTVCLSLELERKASAHEVREALENYRAPQFNPSLPSQPQVVMVVSQEADRPQPRKDAPAGEGMVVSVGRVRSCPVMDMRLVAVVHNTLRGGAGGAILNAELLVTQGYLDGCQHS